MQKFMLSVLVIGVLSTFVMGAGNASAQQTEIAVTPAIIDAPVLVGESVTRTIQITNSNDTPLPLSIEVQAAVLDGEPLDTNMKERYDVSDWVRFADNTYLFEAGETRVIPFTITAPFTALPGGHYAQISIRGLSLETDEVARGLVFPEIGVPVLMTVPGEIIEDARVTEGSIFPLTMTASEEQLLSIPVENTGTVHNIVSGRIVVERRGKIVYEEPLKPGVILPATRKVLVQAWTAPALGRYTAYVELQFGTQRKTVRSAAETFYITPSFTTLFWLAIATWAGLYLWPRRQNMKAALKVIFT